jgi:uncharacterized protein YndB with AHSA1/START domain
MIATTPALGTTAFTTPSDVEAVLSRVFDAPARLVFAAYTEPEHVRKWLFGPPGWTMPVCEIDLRPGGHWRFGWRNENGDTMEMTGVYQEIEPPSRVVNTENWDGDYPETVNTLTFDEVDGRTTMTTTVRYPSKAARDAAISTGMTDGASMSYDRLDAYLPTIA